MLFKTKFLPPAAGCGIPPPPSRSVPTPEKITPEKNDSAVPTPENHTGKTENHIGKKNYGVH